MRPDIEDIVLVASYRIYQGGEVGDGWVGDET